MITAVANFVVDGAGTCGGDAAMGRKMNTTTIVVVIVFGVQSLS